jgi:hypothetical protein
MKGNKKESHEMSSEKKKERVEIGARKAMME